jgi:hypothetical protein
MTKSFFSFFDPYYTTFVQLAVTKIFGAGVDMDKYLGPARTMFDHFSQAEKDEYKKKASRC